MLFVVNEAHVVLSCVRSAPLLSFAFATCFLGYMNFQHVDRDPGDPAETLVPWCISLSLVRDPRSNIHGSPQWTSIGTSLDADGCLAASIISGVWLSTGFILPLA